MADQPKRLPRLPAPDAKPVYAPEAAYEAAATTAIVLNRPEDFEAYRQSFEQAGRINEWEDFKFHYQYSRDSQAAERVIAQMKKHAYDTGLEVSQQDAAKFVQNVVTAGQAPPTVTAPAVVAANAPVPEDANMESITQYASMAQQLDQRIIDLEKSREENVFAMAENFSDKGGVFTSLGSVTTSAFLPTDTPLIAYIASEIGMPYEVGAGEQLSSISEYIKTLPPKEQNAKVRQLIKTVSEIPGVAGFKEWEILSSIVNPDTGVVNTSGLDRFLNDLGTAGDVINAGGLIRLVGKGFKTLKPLRLASVLNAGRPRTSANYMSKLIQDLQTSGLAAKYNISKEAVVTTQLPKPKISLSRDVTPDGVIEDAERAAIARAGISEVDASLRSNLFTAPEVLAKAERVARDIEEVVGPRVRPSLSTVRVHDDGAGVDFETVIGRTTAEGFAGYRSAERFAERLRSRGEDVTVLKSNEKGELVPATGAEKGVGDFYVQMNQRHLLRPEDKMLFGFDPVATGSWLGTAGRWFLSPAGQFDQKIYSAYSQAFAKEAAVAAKLDSIAAPLFRDLSAADRNAVGNMWEWTEQFGVKSGRTPTHSELKAAFPDASPKYLRGWNQLKLFYDTVYEMNNMRLYRDFLARGAKTVRNGDSAYHGTLVPNPDRPVTVLDLATGNSRELTRAEVNRIYDAGGNIMRLDTAVDGSRGKHTLLLAEKGTEWKVKPLERNVLKYIPGYYPRIYRDFYFIERVSDEFVDGIRQVNKQGVTVAQSRAEAEEFVKAMQAKNKDPGVSYQVSDDARLQAKDRTAQDLDRLRTEGRLFFDSRQQQRMYNVNGNLADIIDPINMLNTTTRMVSRQLTTEDLVKSLKASWKETYGDLYRGNFDIAASSAVDAELRTLAKTAGPEAVKRVRQAQPLWDYIRLMEGATTDTAAFKRRAIASAEWLNNALRRVPGLKGAGVALVRNAQNIAPVEFMKRLAYFDFLVTTPVRQLLLQSAQLSFISPLLAFKRPGYLARWHLDTTLLMQGTKRLATAAAGGKALTNQMLHRNAKLMGLGIDEYKLLIQQYENSGLLQTVNVHSFAGDIRHGERVTPETTAGRVGDFLWGAATLRPIREGMEKYGFQLGEQFNLSGSYMAALKVYTKDAKIAKLTDMTAADWKNVGQKASDYALGMNRANSSKYQYGLVSLPLQFLSFTHKTFMVMLKAATFGKVGPQSITVGDAYKILLGQAILFGGAGFGMKPEVEDALAKSGFGNLVGTEVSDIIAGGFVDYIFDKALQSVADDAELDLPFDEFLAPGANVINVLRKMVEAVMEAPAGETALGPSVSPLSGITKAVGVARTLSVAEELPGTPMEKAEIVANAFLGGIAQGYSNATQAYSAAQMGRWLTQGGDPTAVETKWAEVMAKGLLGMNPQSVIDTHYILKDLREAENEIKTDAKRYYEQTNMIINLWADQKIGDQELLAKLAMEKAVLSTLPEEYRLAVRDELHKMYMRDKGQRAGIEFVIANAISRGVPADETLRARIANTPAIQDEGQRASLLQWLDLRLKEQKEAVDKAKENVNRDIETAKELSDAD